MRMINIVCLLPKEWKVFQRRPHYVALSRYAKIICIEPPMNLYTFLKTPLRFLRGLKELKKIQKINDSLYLYQPFSLFPYSISLWLDKLSWLDQKIMNWTLKYVDKKLVLNDYILFIFRPQQACFVDVARPNRLCCELADEYSSVAAFSNLQRRIMREAETKILKKADLVFVTSQGLLESKRKINKYTYFVPNGTDVHSFLEKSKRIPDDMKRIPGPVIGYVGSINATVLDFKLLNFLATRKPKWSVLMAGEHYHIAYLKRLPEYKRSRRLPNIHYLGLKEYGMLADYIFSTDVCIMPYLTNEWMMNSHPNKIYQYLACGKPVVSTNFREATSFNGLVRVAKTYEEFIRLIEEELNKKNEYLVKCRIEFAKQNSLYSRALTKVNIINNFMKV